MDGPVAVEVCHQRGRARGKQGVPARIPTTAAHRSVRAVTGAGRHPPGCDEVAKPPDRHLVGIEPKTSDGRREPHVVVPDAVVAAIEHPAGNDLTVATRRIPHATACRREANTARCYRAAVATVVTGVSAAATVVAAVPVDRAKPESAGGEREERDPRETHPHILSVPWRLGH